MINQEFIEITKCPFCSSEDLSRHRKRSDNVWVLLCDNCDLGFVEKYPKEIQDLYGIDYYEKNNKGSEEPCVGYVDYREINYNYFLWPIALVSLMNVNTSIFDLGCSNGLFLDLAKAYGFNVLSGVEYNREYADICRTKGYQIYNQSFIDINFDKSERFEIVTAWAVLEHIPELNDVIKQIKLILNPEGVLLFEVPCLTFNETEDNYWLSSSLEHIYYFTEKSLKNITSHFFGQEYVGRVVRFDKYGSTIVGCVSGSQLKMKSLKNTGKYLQKINQNDLKNISASDLINYLVFYLKCVNDIQTSKIISQYISEHFSYDSKIPHYFISFLSQDYIKLHEDNVEYTKAKDYFIRQIESSQSELAAIKTSKFWKLRQKWLQFRRLAGVTNDSQSLSFKKVFKNFRQNFRSKKKILVNIEQEECDKNLPLISVIIPCHNYGRYVEEAIDSILDQTFQDFEIIVVDGGSTDRSTTATLKSLQKIKTMIYYREGRHLVGDNRNFGIEKAQGKYICCLDADDKLKPTYLEKALFLLEAYNYDLVSTSVQCFGNSQETWYPSTFPTLETIIEANPIPTVAVFSRQLWKEANGYHDYGIGKDYVAEDWDLWVRMMALGARVVNISEPLMLYRIHGTHTSLSRHPESMSWNEQGKIIENFNQKYLTRQAYSRSRKNNRTSYKVVNGSINLTNSYSKQAKKEDKLKILFALPFVITGGADSILLQIAKHLSESNFDVSIMTTIKTDTKFGDNTSRYEKITQEIYHLYNFLDDQSSWKDFIYYYLESRQIDILFIVGSSYFYEILPEIKKYFPRIKVIDQLFNEYGHINNNRKYSKFIDMNILASQIIQDVLQQKYQEIEEKTRVITHGVDTQKEFNPININCQGTNGIIPKNKFIVSYMGRFAEEKCPQIFIDIAYKLRDYKNIYFLMLGNGPEYNSSKLKIEKLGLYEKIYSPGFVEDNKPFLKVTDLLIIPSKIEGIPIILMESLSLGIPVIASSIGGIPDIIENNYNGFLCDPNDTDDFVDKIIQVYSDKNLQNQLKSNARNYAETSLDISKMNSEYLDIFISLTNRNTLTN